jgi:hypothetical protein
MFDGLMHFEQHLGCNFRFRFVMVQVGFGTQSKILLTDSSSRELLIQLWASSYVLAADLNHHQTGVMV